MSHAETRAANGVAFDGRPILRSRRSMASSAFVTSASRFTRRTVSTDAPVRAATSVCECPARSRTWISWRFSRGNISSAWIGLRAISADSIMRHCPFGRSQISRNGTQQISRNHHQASEIAEANPDYDADTRLMMRERILELEVGI